MKCGRCHSEDVNRVARQGFFDHLWSLRGYFPWRCRSCSHTFRARLRRETPRPRVFPRLEYRPEPESHTAAIVIRAESGEQLTHVLLALSEAVSREQRASRTGTREAHQI